MMRPRLDSRLVFAGEGVDNEDDYKKSVCGGQSVCSPASLTFLAVKKPDLLSHESILGQVEVE